MTPMFASWSVYSYPVYCKVPFAVLPSLRFLSAAFIVDVPFTPRLVVHSASVRSMLAKNKLTY